jgi:hypothetical protein
VFAAFYELWCNTLQYMLVLRAIQAHRKKNPPKNARLLDGAPWQEPF